MKNKKKPWGWVFRGWVYKGLSDLAIDYGLDVQTVWQRLYKYNWTLEEALKLKKRKRKGPRYKQVKIGDRFNFLEATSVGWMCRKKQRVMAKCLRCNSGEEDEYQVGNLRGGKKAHTKSCGCLSRDTTSEVKRIGIKKGQTHGHWLALEDCRTVETSPLRHVKSHCTRCNDGVVRDKSATQFLRTKSCAKCSRHQSVNVTHDIGKGDLFGENRLCAIGNPFTNRTTKTNRRSVFVFCLNCTERIFFPATVQYLVDGVTTSCGCYQREQASKAAVRDLWENVKFWWIYNGNRGRHLMRSRWELAIANALDEREVVWEYEPEPFKLANGLRYTPDFYLPKTNEYIEVKGRRMKDWKKNKDCLNKIINYWL